MAEKFVSPGVFTRENDASFLPQGIADIGTAVVGTFPTGPAFTPVVVRSIDEFRTRFGGEDRNYYATYAAKNVLTNANQVTIVRVGELGGYNHTGHSITATTDIGGVAGETSVIMLAPARGVTALTVTNVAVAGATIELTVNGVDYIASFDPTAENYFTKVFGTNPLGIKSAYVYSHAETSNRNIDDYTDITVANATQAIDFDNQNAQSAATPYVTSQNINNTVYNLFRFVTLNTGTDTNTQTKISIQNVKRAGEIGDVYGRFDVIIRAFSDTDERPVVLERFSGINLNPSSPNFISRVIGDNYRTVNESGDLTTHGDYPNASMYVRMEVADGFDTFPPTVVPAGFGGYKIPFDSGTISELPLADVGTSARIHYGIDFDGSTDWTAYIAPKSDDSTDVTSPYTLPDALFATAATSTTIQIQRRFTIGFEGGFNGAAPNLVKHLGTEVNSAANVGGLDFTNVNSSGSVAFTRALNAISNPLEFDYNLLLTPGISKDYGGSVIDRAREIVEDRADAFYIADLTWIAQSNDKAIADAAAYNSSYMASYYPWVKIVDTSTTRPMWVPPSVVMGGVFAFSDAISTEWFAPAGLNRGNITQAIDTYKKLKRSDMNLLYDSKVNPIVSFPGQGITAYGQKTLQTSSSALDRINVRRLMINLKKFISSASRFLVFDPNTLTTRNKFLSLVEPYLDLVQQNQGIFAYRVVVDDTVNTPEVIDRNQLIGKIFIQPVKSAEFIVLDFNVLPTGAEFA